MGHGEGMLECPRGCNAFVSKKVLKSLVKLSKEFWTLQEIYCGDK
jgi:hypothetical protein